MKDYFIDYKVKTALAIFLKFVEACFELMLPLLMVSLINDGILLGNQNHVFKMASIMVLLTILGYLASITCQYYASIIAQRVGGRLRLALMQKMITMDQGLRDQYDHSTLIIRSTTDIDRIQDMIARTIRLAVRAPMIIIGSVAAMYFLNPLLSYYLLASIPVFVVVILLFMKMSVNAHKSVQKQWDRFTYKIREFLSGARIIFAFNKSGVEKEVMNDMNQTLSHNQKKMAQVTSLSSPLISLMMNFLLVFLVYVGAIQIQKGAMNSSQILALINYCTQIVLTLIVFMNLMMIFSKGYASWGRVKEILNLEPMMDCSGDLLLNTDTFDVAFEDVSFAYGNDEHEVLKNLNFTIKTGTTVGIVGLTGSGKSTLLKLIIRMYDVRSGKITINGIPIQDYDVQDVKAKVGYIAQKPQFLSGSLQDAISLDPSVDHRYYLKLAQGSDILDKGMSAPVSKDGNNFSGGQRQRMSIARQLSKRPKIILFDDSFSALDTITDRLLREALDQLDDSLSKIIVSQRTSTILNADNILVMDQGRVVAQGTHHELLASNSLYQQIHALNIREETYETV